MMAVRVQRTTKLKTQWGFKMGENRKIIQITIGVPTEGFNYNVLYALCNDGTLWWKNEVEGSQWHLDIPIPQD